MQGWRHAYINLNHYVKTHLPIEFNFVNETLDNIYRAEASLIRAEEILKALFQTAEQLGMIRLQQLRKPSMRMAERARIAIRQEFRRQQKEYVRSMQTQGYLTYNDLCQIAADGGMVRWRATGIVETLRKEKKGYDRRLWAEGPVTKEHVISKKRTEFFWCERLNPKTPISFGEILTSADRLAAYPRGSRLLKPL